MIRVKVTAENDGRQYALMVPAIIDSDGAVTITHLAASAAAGLLRAEAFAGEDEKTREFIRRANLSSRGLSKSK